MPQLWSSSLLTVQDEPGVGRARDGCSDLLMLNSTGLALNHAHFVTETETILQQVSELGPEVACMSHPVISM